MKSFYVLESPVYNVAAMERISRPSANILNLYRIGRNGTEQHDRYMTGYKRERERNQKTRGSIDRDLSHRIKIIRDKDCDKVVFK